MTDAVQGGTEWVPPMGMLNVPADRAALIRGLFELAAFVADHPEIKLPYVTAGFYPNEKSFEAGVAVVDQVAGALGVTAEMTSAGGSYMARSSFGPVHVSALQSTPESDAAYEAHMSYRGNVQPAEGVAAGESR